MILRARLAPRFVSGQGRAHSPASRAEKGGLWRAAWACALWGCLGLAVLSPWRVASAQAVGLGMAQAKHCVACHRVEQKVVGPPFTAIAERFKGETAAIPHLAQRIREGSRGQWGAIGMPRQDDVSQAEAEQLAAWILSLYRGDD